MALTGNGKFISAGRANTKYLTIPAKLITDSAFPFEEGEEVKITVDSQNKRLVVEKIR
ncbi:hypothetical protein [Methanolacinia paynteri]|uniref:hypothetical protein n=1 Tax=Methanolacinia paynteri TaxID=230356 RepID=UPI00146FCAAD|nr:hypothetical protein [Methanolacinia paynteri]